MKEKFLSSSPSEIDLKAYKTLGTLHDLCDSQFIHVFKEKQKKKDSPFQDLLMKIKWM